MKTKKDFWSTIWANCYIGRDTAIRENKTTFNFPLEKKESICWFCIDTHTNANSNVYDFYSDPAQQKVCDFIGIYTRNEAEDQRRVLNQSCILLVELKSQNHLRRVSSN